MPLKLQIQVARAFSPLLPQRRYRGAKGGRGAAKSHFVAEQLIKDCIESHQRIVCAREFQSSIAESSKQLIEDKIHKFGLDDLFKITDNEIVGPHDSLWVFKGLAGNSVQSLKSFEGFTRFWNEEAQSTAQHSLNIICPTFRSGSQLWFTWNPISKKDPVDRYFEESCALEDPDFAQVHVTYKDNPWFPEELKSDMERDRRRDPDKYAHVWLGKYANLSSARVFTNWSIEQFETPGDARFYFGADWGFSIDPTVLIRCFIRGERLYIDYEAYKVGCKIGDTPKLFERVPESNKWPIRADCARPETIDYMKDHGFPKMEPSIKGANSVKDGIEFLKDFDIVVHPRCVYTADELSSYSYKIDRKTEEVLPVLGEKKNHVIDSLRYAVESVRHSRGLNYTKADADAIIAMLGRGGKGRHSLMRAR